ncbi:MAG: helix-turn-helix domain-containing protein [Fusobacteriaceae bacterium]
MLKLKIKYLMIDNNIKNISELARETGINRATLTKLYNGDRPETLILENLFKICDFFNCKLSDIIEYTPDENSLKYK